VGHTVGTDNPHEDIPQDFEFDGAKQGLDMDMGLCTVGVKYTPERIRSKVLNGPIPTLRLLARGWEGELPG
jgi:hypothetical protein